MMRRKGKESTIAKIIRSITDASQVEIAEKLGVAKSTVSHWFSGISQPNIEHLKRIARAFKTDVRGLYIAMYGLENCVAEGLIDRRYADEYIIASFDGLWPEYQDEILDYVRRATAGEQIDDDDMLLAWGPFMDYLARVENLITPAESTENAVSNVIRMAKEGYKIADGTLALPKLGHIACGEPKDFYDPDETEMIPTTAEEFGSARYWLQADGLSMWPTIQPGDLILIENFPTPFHMPPIVRGIGAQFGVKLKEFLREMNGKLVTCAVNPDGGNDVSLKRLRFYDKMPHRATSRNFDLFLEADNAEWARATDGWGDRLRWIQPTDELVVYGHALSVRRPL